MVFQLAETRTVTGIRIGLWTSNFDLTLLVETDDGTIVEASTKIRTQTVKATHELMLPTPVAEARTITVVIDKHGDTKAHIQEIVFLP